MTDDQEALLHWTARHGDGPLLAEALTAALDELARLRRGPAAVVYVSKRDEWHAHFDREEGVRQREAEKSMSCTYLAVQSWTWHGLDGTAEGEGS